MRSPLFILLATFILTLIVAQEFTSERTGGEGGKPLDVLGLMLNQHPDLGAALAAADRDEPAPLLAWLNGAAPLSRQKLSRVLVSAAMAAADVPAEDATRRSDQAIYRWRRRFAAFANIPTGSPDVDAELDNLIAYIAVAGTAAPTTADLALARSLLPRIEKSAARDPNHAVYDTVGCINFVAGDYARARIAFTEAVRLGEKNIGSGEAGKHAALALPLYRERLAAAVAADLRTVEQRADPATRPHLPLASLSPAQPPAPTPAAAPPTDAKPR